MNNYLDNFKRLDIDWLFEADWNYKQNDDELLDKLVRNMKNNNQMENIIVRQVGKRWEVVNGNHRLQAMRQLGYSQVMVYDLGEVRLAEAKRIALETNETKFQADPFELGKMLQELIEEFDITELCATTPYTEGEVHNYIDLLDMNPEFEDEPPPGEPAHELSVTISYNIDDEMILEDLQKVVDKYRSAVLK